MVVVAQLVRALDCGSRGRRFEPGLPPLVFKKVLQFLWNFLFDVISGIVEKPVLNEAEETRCKIQKQRQKSNAKLGFSSSSTSTSSKINPSFILLTLYFQILSTRLRFAAAGQANQRINPFTAGTQFHSFTRPSADHQIHSPTPSLPDAGGARAGRQINKYTILHV